MSNLIENESLVMQPRIVVKKNEKKGDEPQLKEYALKIVVEGTACRTSATATFYNPVQRDLEGELVFPLPDGVTVSGFALDIDGFMRDATVVAKEKARATLEKEERRRVDPGIVEWTQGNQFRTRIYPLPAKGIRIVRVDTVSTIQLDESRRFASCRIPIKFESPVKKFSLEVVVVKAGIFAQTDDTLLSADDWQDTSFKFSHAKNGWVAQTKRENFQPVRDIFIEIPLPQTVEPQYERSDRGVYGAIPFDASLFPTENVERSSSQTIPNLTIFWDCSGSRTEAGRSGGRESVFLGKTLKATDVRTVRVVPVRDTVDESEIVELSRETARDFVSDVLDVIERLPCDGASNIGAIERFVREEDCSFLFSDGMNNWSSTSSEFSSPIFVFSSGSAFNTALLRKIACSGGGAYFNLDDLSTDPTLEQFQTIYRNGSQVFSIEGENVEFASPEYEPSKNRAIQFIYSRIVNACEPAIIRIKRSGRLIKQDEISPDRWSNAVRGDGVEKLFAQKKLERLLMDERRNESLILELGIRHSMVTPYTSLIVLETLEQYLEHQICPPESLPQLRKEYLEYAAKQSLSEEERKQNRLDYVSEIWSKRIQWWESDYAEFEDELEDIENEDSEDRSQFAAQENLSRFDVMEELSLVGYRSRKSDEEIESDNVFYCPCMDEADGSSVDYIDNVVGSADYINARDDSPLEKSFNVVVKPWIPDSIFLDTLDKSGSLSDAYQKYIEMRKDNRCSPSFYLQCAEWFKKKDQRRLAIRILSNLVEMDTEDPQTLRILGRLLQEWGELRLAIDVFETTLVMRPEEPQSYRDLALTLAERAIDPNNPDSPESKKESVERALELLNCVIMGRNYEDWDSRFPEIEVIALEEANALIPRARSMGIDDVRIDERFIILLDVDLRVVLTWHADNTDIDLWVIEPNGEKAYYSHNLTSNGGLISRDFMDGYGPEEYMIRKAIPGKYEIIANFFGSRAVEIFGEVVAQADVFTNFGRDNQTLRRLTFPLNEVEENYLLGEVDL